MDGGWEARFAEGGEARRTMRVLGGEYPFFRVVSERPAPGEVTVEGRRLINASSNDYLGLSGDPRVREAAERAVRDLGTSCSASAVTAGTLALHRALEDELAALLRRPAVALAPTGYQANAALGCLFGPHDVVVADQSSHASLIDATQLGRAPLRRFRHNDASHLDLRLGALRDVTGEVVVLTEGLFSVDGDLAALPAIAEATERHGARLVVDGAHDIGVLGDHGRGAAELFGVEDGIDVVTGTFSKALGSIGGFVAGPTDLVEYLRHYGRSAVFSAAMTPAAAAAALTSVRLVRDEPERRRHVAGLASRLRRGLGLAGDAAHAAPTLCLPSTGLEHCVRTWQALFAAGVWATLMGPPAAPRGAVRLSVTAEHTTDHVDRILEAVAATHPVIHHQRGELPLPTALPHAD